MLGSNLMRYAVDRKFLIFDKESNGLSLHAALPWEISYGVATLKNGLQSVVTEMIYWPNYYMPDYLAAKVHFDRARYERDAKPAREVLDRFAALLYSTDHYAVGHNLLGYDAYLLSSWQRACGLPPDYSWIYRPVVDTNCIAKAYLRNWVPDTTSPESFVAFQYKCQSFVEQGLKSSLGAMCREFNIDYDEKAAHSAQYDIERNWLVFKELAWKVAI